MATAAGRASARLAALRAATRRGMKAVREVVEGAVEAGVEILTLYAFSQENWNRPATRGSALMALLQRYVRGSGRAAASRACEVAVFGELRRLAPQAARGRSSGSRCNARAGDDLRLNLMISYGGRAEIVRAARLIAERVQAGRAGAGGHRRGDVRRRSSTPPGCRIPTC